MASMLGATQLGPGQAPGVPGAMLVTTKHGSVIVPANFPRRESKDSRMHACMRPTDGGMRLICIFMPPAM
jgi:acyl CoA:acetate/3-ketoacid CoA transferase beta subunit